MAGLAGILLRKLGMPFQPDTLSRAGLVGESEIHANAHEVSTRQGLGGSVAEGKAILLLARVNFRDDW